MTVGSCAWFFLLMLVAGSDRAAPAPRPDDGKPASAPHERGETAMPWRDVGALFDRILDDLWNTNQKVREAGLNHLSELLKRTQNLGVPIGLKALRAAARPYPYETPEHDEVSNMLASVAEASPSPEYVPVILEGFGTFSDGAK